MRDLPPRDATERFLAQMLPADRVRVLAKVLGRELHFEAQSDAAARAEMSAAMPAAYVEAFFSFFADGKLDESTVLPTVQDVLGRPPGTFEQWAIAPPRHLKRRRSDNQHAFSGPAELEGAGL